MTEENLKITIRFLKRNQVQLEHIKLEQDQLRRNCMHRRGFCRFVATCLFPCIFLIDMFKTDKTWS